MSSTILGAWPNSKKIERFVINRINSRGCCYWCSYVIFFFSLTSRFFFCVLNFTHIYTVYLCVYKQTLSLYRLIVESLAQYQNSNEYWCSRINENTYTRRWARGIRVKNSQRWRDFAQSAEILFAINVNVFLTIVPHNRHWMCVCVCVFFFSMWYGAFSISLCHSAVSIRGPIVEHFPVYSVCAYKYTHTIRCASVCVHV